MNYNLDNHLCRRLTKYKRGDLDSEDLARKDGNVASSMTNYDRKLSVRPMVRWQIGLHKYFLQPNPSGTPATTEPGPRKSPQISTQSEDIGPPGARVSHDITRSEDKTAVGGHTEEAGVEA